MQIKIERKLTSNPKVLLRKCGYKPWRDPRKREEAFIRRLGASFYPRFHVFWHYNRDKSLVLDLHLDARRPMHKKGIRSFEDKETEVVRKEAARISDILGKI